MLVALAKLRVELTLAAAFVRCSLILLLREAQQLAPEGVPEEDTCMSLVPMGRKMWDGRFKM